VGYWVAAPARGRGVAVRAVRLLCAWGFEARGLPRIQLHTLPGNVASERVAERAGFTREGLLRSFAVMKGRRTDITMFSLLPGELWCPD
jgi:RimJ/RimL family protein N-acetyltransferase